MRSKTLMYASVIAILALTSTAGMAFAENDADLKVAFADMLIATGTLAGTGVGAGALMSILRVIGKNISESDPKKKEPFNVAKLLITMGIGAAVGTTMSFAGIPAEQALGLDFLVIFFVNQTIRPILQHWKLK